MSTTKNAGNKKSRGDDGNNKGSARQSLKSEDVDSVVGGAIARTDEATCKDVGGTWTAPKDGGTIGICKY